MNLLKTNEEKIELLRKCLKLYSPSGEEEEVAHIYREILIHNGFKIIPSEVGNVVGIKGNGQPILLLSSHMDTVPPELPFKETETHIYARGAVDCKPAWISMLISGATYDWENLFKKYNNSGTIIICGTVSEENNTIGIKDFFKTKIQPDVAIFGEPTKINRICYAYRGRIWIEGKCKAKQGHASSSWNTINPIHVMMNFWDKLKKIGISYEKPLLDPNNEKKHFDETTLTLTSIHAGLIGNSTPESCTMEIDIRFPPCKEIERYLKEIETCRKETSEDYNTEIEIDVKSKIEGVETDTNTTILNALRWAIFKITGKKTKILKKTGTTFMNLIKKHYSIPTIVYGPGDPKLEHGPDEVISKEEFLQTCEIYNIFFEKFFEMWKKSNN
ncbi:MAG: M20/M25/M40 family metallo-hydrolase [archaeon]|nr:M20/M25/M40 family metallo-hydrolase [archaeon]